MQTSVARPALDEENRHLPRPGMQTCLPESWGLQSTTTCSRSRSVVPRSSLPSQPRLASSSTHGGLARLERLRREPSFPGPQLERLQRLTPPDGASCRARPPPSRTELYHLRWNRGRDGSLGASASKCPAQRGPNAFADGVVFDPSAADRPPELFRCR